MPEGQCLVNVDGCYECGSCDRPLPPVGDDDDDDDDDCDLPFGECEICVNGGCVPDLCCDVECGKCQECNPLTGKCFTDIPTCGMCSVANWDTCTCYSAEECYPGSAMCAWICGIDRNDPNSNVVEPDMDAWVRGDKLCSDVLEEAKCECKEGYVALDEPATTKQTCCPQGYVSLCPFGQRELCCSGTIYRPLEEEDCECCTGATEENPTHVVVSALGAPDGQQACCSIERHGTSPSAYGNGSSVVCCSGKIYRSGTDAEGNAVYGCCSGDTAENPTSRVVTLVNAPDGVQGCCNVVDGMEPTAWWNSTSLYPLECCTRGNNSVVKVTGKCYESDPDGYTCCGSGVTAAVAGQSWSNCYGHCCEVGQVGALAGEHGVCCQPGEKAYDDGSKRCCPVGWKLETDYWPSACCPPGQTPCMGSCCSGECDKYWWEEEYCAEEEYIVDENGDLIDAVCIRWVTEGGWIGDGCLE